MARDFVREEREAAEALARLDVDALERAAESPLTATLAYRYHEPSATALKAVREMARRLRATA